MSDNVSSEYTYHDAEDTWALAYLWGPLRRTLAARFPRPASLFELGCGNGSTANKLHELGWQVVGVDPSKSGIEMANRHFPGLRLEEGNAYDDLAGKYGRFQVVVSLEVVEHVFDPRAFARTVYRLLDDGGVAILSTPYHGYLKNLVLAASGKLDDHFTALWDGGHIKFWSVKTLTTLLREAGFRHVEFLRVGRIPQLAKSMIAIAEK